jgi:hypothetical protein
LVLISGFLYAAESAKPLTTHSKGEKVTVEAHGGSIDIQGVTIAQVNDKLQVQSLETWFDPLEMFRQIAPNGIHNDNSTPILEDQKIPKHGDIGNENAAAGSITPTADCPFLANVATDHAGSPMLASGGVATTSATPKYTKNDTVARLLAPADAEVANNEELNHEKADAVIAPLERAEASSE